MPSNTTFRARGARRSATATYAVRVGSDWTAIRAAAIWPIADVLGIDPAGEPSRRPASTAAAAEARLAIDLLDSGMIAPPRPRRRRDRPVSSRAVFYQAAGA